MDQIKNWVVCALSALFGAIEPIHNILEACMLVFATNLIAGVIAGVLAQKERFEFKKAINCLLEAAIIMVLIAMILIVGDNTSNHGGAMSAISVVVYALYYFYGVNILKNLTRLFPSNALFKFLYYVVSLEMIDKIPFLAAFKQRMNGEEAELQKQDKK